MADVGALCMGLEEFGLSKYESQAYVTLVSRGTMSASELAYYSGLPRTKVYPVMLKLQKKRLATISRDKSAVYTAAAPEEVFDGAIQEQIGRINAMNTMVSGLKRLNDANRRSRGAQERRYLHLSAGNTLERLRAMIGGAKESIHIMADQLGLGLFAECREQLLLALRRDVDIRIIIPHSQVGSESFRAIPGEVRIRVSDTVQNCFVFDGSELLMVDSRDGGGAVFSSADMLGSDQSRMFAHIWKYAARTGGVEDMTKAEAQDIYKMMRAVDEGALGHALNSSMVSKCGIDMLKVLERGGIRLGERSMDDVIEMVDSALQISCSGHASFDAKARNILVESKANNGSSLPWVAVIDGYLKKTGHKTKMTYRSRAQKGEMVHLKFDA